jgi:mevalonate kinase
VSSGLAKVILLGEHAVVHGYPALAGAIDRRVTARITARSNELALRCQAWDLDVVRTADHPVASALGIIADQLGFAGKVEIEARTTVPAAAGLGSSAALCVAVTRCLAEAMGTRVADSDEIQRIANLAEAAFHENPSGVDVALATLGGIGVFRKDTGFRRLACPPIEVAIGLSGETRSTAAMVERVRARLEADPSSRAALDALGGLAERGVEVLESGSGEAELGSLFTEAQDHLARFELSSPGLDRLLELARGAGASGAKLTGAGGGGAVIAVGDSKSEIIRAWKGAGFDGFVARVGALP